MNIKILYLIYLLFITFTTFSQNISPIDKMLNTIDNIKTLSCTIKSTERLADKTVTVQQKITTSFNPLKCHIEYIAPKKGTEIIYNDGENENELHYQPSGFPYFDLNLDPLGNLARRNNHHTIQEIGFNYFANIVKNEIKKSSTSFEVKKIILDNKEQYYVHAKYDDFKYIPYKMKIGETIRQIALKNSISEYLILHMNKNLESYDDWSNEEILIPNHYCREIKFYIDSSSWLPSSIEILDENGTLERYEYFNLKTNIEIDPNTFNIN